jgi:hypothetical protein
MEINDLHELNLDFREPAITASVCHEDDGNIRKYRENQRLAEGRSCKSMTYARNREQ